MAEWGLWWKRISSRARARVCVCVHQRERAVGGRWWERTAVRSGRVHMDNGEGEPLNKAIPVKLRMP